MPDGGDPYEAWRTLERVPANWIAWGLWMKQSLQTPEMRALLIEAVREIDRRALWTLGVVWPEKMKQTKGALSE